MAQETGSLITAGNPFFKVKLIRALHISSSPRTTPCILLMIRDLVSGWVLRIVPFVWLLAELGLLMVLARRQGGAAAGALATDPALPLTIGNIDGIVSRIRIRATTLTTWDRKEYLVPNKEFITGRVLNWTLSNSINRVIITAGIAYGSDTELARELLLNAAQEHPNVLEDPAPIATFEGFGDSALNFLLRCYLPNLDNRLVTITELHTAIDQAFRKAGITIASPQRDVHLDSTNPQGFRGMPEQGHTGAAEPQTDRA